MRCFVTNISPERPSAFCRGRQSRCGSVTLGKNNSPSRGPPRTSVPTIFYCERRIESRRFVLANRCSFSQRRQAVAKRFALAKLQATDVSRRRWYPPFLKHKKTAKGSLREARRTVSSLFLVYAIGFTLFDIAANYSISMVNSMVSGSRLSVRITKLCAPPASKVKVGISSPYQEIVPP